MIAAGRHASAGTRKAVSPPQHKLGVAPPSHFPQRRWHTIDFSSVGELLACIIPKGKLMRDAESDVYYFLISSKRAM